ncbi:hypothetical protein PHYSODRAFT_306616 [Phytophthora sojae]|uniref:Uncharacterized protein n=1 Tax=Phytophthora sojae (strain P6497) TaxID=1094619 RepID=G5AA12_PHYSP|nr:hypothetical protein PHYSODRAFT_306616 [Phytophthora sojae]EGZ07441.1 hypothetical protein PHYSODRAFT_306616 [Phytophthora sojae]|eukprot:XP_009537007.1 hypothetical protein PHYSODRAFT_306616 [Phytophthora sojae]
MYAQAGWHRRGPAGGGVRRPAVTSAARVTCNSSRASSATAQQRMAPGGALRASNQASERGANARKSGSTEPEAAPSRWREMRQSVRTKATLETEESRPVNAKIADLCPEDREKVAKLVRRIVEVRPLALSIESSSSVNYSVGTLHEEGEKEFNRQREVLEAEVKELREQVRRDAEEIQELTAELRSTRRKAQLFEERVVVLEESTNAETRSRLEAEQTLDLLKLEVDKLRALVQRQQEEMRQKTQEQQEQFDAELLQMKEELKEAQELLLKERNERILEKQTALDQRLERSATAGEEKLERLHSLLLEQQQEMHLKVKQQQEEMQRKAEVQKERYKAEMNQLKEDLKAAQERLQQERRDREIERETKQTAVSERPVEPAPVVHAADRDSDVPVPDPLMFASSDRMPDQLSTDMEGDLAIFEEVKDLYAEDLFASRRWGEGIPAASAAAAVRPTGMEPAPWHFSSADFTPPDNGRIPLGPALSTQELTVQEAIERDMEALLRSEALRTLGTLQ